MRSFVWILRLLTLSQSRNLATFHRSEIALPHVKSPSNSALIAAVTPSPAANRIRIITMNNFKKKIQNCTGGHLSSSLMWGLFVGFWFPQSIPVLGKKEISGDFL